LEEQGTQAYTRSNVENLYATIVGYYALFQRVAKDGVGKRRWLEETTDAFLGKNPALYSSYTSCSCSEAFPLCS